jgi:hypothetical protein
MTLEVPSLRSDTLGVGQRRPLQHTRSRYRWRLSLAKGEARYEPLEQQFCGKYSHPVLKDIGHNVPQEAPQEFAKAIVEVDGY